ncbi:MAG: ABC transporter ATP-binding protein [Flavobacteriaceae bacterium]|nr:ABC transporter ATP-binding protein [Flavobacteriaceae bacterium]
MYLEVENLVKSYGNNLVIKNLTFSIEKGQLISFVGESGSGKSTFLKCLSGLENINSGKVILNNKIINDKSLFVKPQRRKIGYVFQDYPLFPHLNIRENICFNLEKRYFKNFEDIVKLTNLKPLLERYPHEISGGEQQRVSIARSIIREPDLLLLDEPFSNLDANIKYSIRDEICKIIKKTNTTTILVTHDINDALNISDKILIFKAGIVQQYSDPEKMYCEPANCYCAEVLGEINKFPKDDKIYYIRPENLKVVDSSSNSIIIEKCFFQGKSYKLLGKYENNIWSLYSKTPLKINSEVFFEYSDSDLIYFGDSCPNFFS